MSPRWSIWWLLLPILVLGSVWIGLNSASLAPYGQNSPAIGKPAPRLDLIPLTDGAQRDRLDGITRGKVTLIHFWGTWCGPCKLEYPHLAAMVGRLESLPGFRFVSVSCEDSTRETFAGLSSKTQDYFRSEQIRGIAFADPQGITRRSVAHRLERASMFYPTSLVIGADGNIAGVWEGYAPETVFEMEDFIDGLL